jgi:hypothetical protein
MSLTLDNDQINSGQVFQNSCFTKKYFQAFVSKSVMDELKRIIEESEVCSASVAMKNMNNVC